MPRCLRPCLLALAVALGLLAAAVLALNLHLQSAGMQEQLRAAAVDTVGLPLNVRSAFYTPWDGIRLRGLVMPDTENAGVNFLEASEFQIVFRLLPLLRREFVVSRLSLKEAVLTWRQNSEGQWRVPRDAELAVPVAAGTPAVARPAPPATVAPGVPVEEPRPTSAPVFALRVEGMEIRRSRILFENRDGWPLLDADGISARASVTPTGDAAGQASIPEAVLAGLIVARDLGADFTLEEGQLDLTAIRGEVAGGTLGGGGSIATRSEGSPYQWDLNLANLDMAQLRLPGSFGGTRFEGLLSAKFHLEGRNAPNRRVRGGTRVDLAQGRLIPSSYLQGLGQALGIRELRGMDISEAYAVLRIEDDLIHVEPLWLRAEEFAVEMRGPITRGGGLDLKARLLLSPTVAQRVSGLTGRQLGTTSTIEGYREVPFTVTGTLEKPRSDLASRLLGGGAAGRLGEMFLNFLGAP
jgi:hypothetical protein